MPTGYARCRLQVDIWRVVIIVQQHLSCCDVCWNRNIPTLSFSARPHRLLLPESKRKVRNFTRVPCWRQSYLFLTGSASVTRRYAHWYTSSSSTRKANGSRYSRRDRATLWGEENEITPAMSCDRATSEPIGVPSRMTQLVLSAQVSRRA